MWPFTKHVMAAKAAADGFPVQVQAALIAAAVSLLTVVLSEVFLRMRTRRTAKQTIRETYQKYADPLAFSSIDLFLRLREAFDDKGAGFYLKGNVHLTRYEHYKSPKHFVPVGQYSRLDPRTTARAAFPSPDQSRRGGKAGFSVAAVHFGLGRRWPCRDAKGEVTDKPLGY